jgi:hypothetical protein
MTYRRNPFPNITVLIRFLSSSKQFTRRYKQVPYPVQFLRYNADLTSGPLHEARIVSAVYSPSNVSNQNERETQVQLAECISTVIRLPESLNERTIRARVWSCRKAAHLGP